MSETLLRKLSQNNPMYSSSHEIEHGLYGCQNYSVPTAKSTECRHEKGAGPTVVKTSLAFALYRKCVA